MEKPIDAAWFKGMVAADDSPDLNPFLAGTDEHAAWHVGRLMALEDEAERQSSEYQVDQLITEVEREVALQQMGYTQIIERIQRVAVTLGRYLVMPVCITGALDERRGRLLELAKMAAAVRHPREEDTRMAEEQARETE